MSRCLPFPPPGYIWNEVSGESLLQLIERERAEAEREKREEKRRRKIEKKKKKKKEREQGEIWLKKRGHCIRHKRLRSNEGEERCENQGKSEYGTQEVESSSLTEEFEQPIFESLDESSDNSESILRKRNSRSGYEYRSLVQIDFQMQKHKKPEALCSKSDCSTRVMDSIVQKQVALPVDEKISSASGMVAADVQEFVPSPVKELCHSCQRARLKMEVKSKMTWIESQFRELIVNWIPPPVQIDHFDVDDQEWLFKRKPPRSDILETSNASKDVLHHENSMSCPYDQFLLHALAIVDSEVQRKLELDTTPVKEQMQSSCSSPATDSQELATPPLKVLCHTSSQGTGIDNEESEIAPTSSSSDINLLQIESQFRDLIENLIPPSLRFEPFDIGDQEWHLKMKQPRRNTRDTSTATYDVVLEKNVGQYPHAQYLPQANIYALPYRILH